MTNKAGTPIEVGSAPDAIAITPDGRTAYVANFGGHSVTPINLETNEPGPEIKVEGEPSGVAITPDGKTAYVSEEGSDTVSAIEVATNKVTAEISVGAQPDAIALAPNGQTAYVANGVGESVTPVEVATNMPGAEIHIGARPGGIAITPDSETAYVTDFEIEKVTPIKLATGELEQRITVGSEPLGIAITNRTVHFGPTIVTQAATEVTPTFGQLNATVNPNEETVSACKFEYGTTTAYGSTALCTPSPGSGNSPVSVSASLSGLAAGTTYHYRISATNASGTSEGADQTFTTFLNSNSATTESPSEPAEAVDGTVSAAASGGAGTVTVGQYGENAGGLGLFAGVGESVDVYQSAASSFSKIEYEDCELHGGHTLYWFDPEANGGAGAWELVTPQTYAPGAPACIEGVAEASDSSPSLAQMKGTRFKAAGALEAPEFGRCAAIAENTASRIYEGFFAAKTCLEKSEITEGLGAGEGDGKYEWYLDVLEEQPNQQAVHFTLTSSAVKLETAEKAFKVTCSGGSGAGEYTGPKTLGDIALTFSDCSQGGQECASAGAGQGEIRTSTLEGELGWEQKATKVGLELQPDSGPFIAFSCGGTAISVRGAVIAPMKANKASSAPALKIKGSKGVQKPEGFEDGQKSVLEESEAMGAYEPMSLSVKVTQNNEDGALAAINTAY